MPRPLRTARGQILDWAEQGALPPENVDRALRVADVLPTAGEWRRFVEALFLWTGTLLVAAGVIFFFAYNWQDMGRFLKFGLVELLLLASVATVLVAGLDRATGKAALFMASVMTGALLALIGQTYQTGADPYQLFAWWSVLILPWVAVSRLPALWLLLVLLLNLTIGLYFQTFTGIAVSETTAQRTIWSLFTLNASAVVFWEIAAAMGHDWLQPRWPARLLTIASGIFATFLGVWAVFEFRSLGLPAVAAYALWCGAVYFYYRHRRRDVFVLAGGVLSAIVVIACVLTKMLVDTGGDAGAFLVIGIAVLGMSAAGAWWLKQVAAEDDVAEEGEGA